MKENNKQKNINGPINIIRLEGEINSIKKVLYVFLDIHVNIRSQTKCDDVRSTEVQKYFQEAFDNISGTNTIYDFFLEMHPSKMLNATTNNKKIYIHEMTDFFVKSFQIEKNNKSEKFTNVRFHFADIRDYLFGLINVYYNFNDMMNNLHGNILNYNFFSEMANIVVNITKSINLLYDAIFTNKYDGEKIIKPRIIEDLSEHYKKSQENIDNSAKYLISKIKHKYNNEDVQKKINLIIRDFENDFVKFHKLSRELAKIVSKRDNDTKNEGKYNPNAPVGNRVNYGITYYQELSLESAIDEEMEKFDGIIITIMSKVMDLYFLRRFLDKDYVTNGVVYVGGLHGTFYVFNLIKYFSFKITNYSFLKGDNTNLIEKIIKENDDEYILTEYLYPEELVQCSNMSGFPKNFD